MADNKPTTQLNWASLLLCLGLSVAVVTLGLWVYHQKFAPRLMVVDVMGFNLAQKQALMDGKIDEKEALRRVEVIKTTLAKYPDNVVFLRKDLVMEHGQELQFDF